MILARFLLPVALVVMAANPAAGRRTLPAPPFPDLAAAAEWIVAGTVVRVADLENASIATIEIAEQLKNERAARTVDVAFQPGLLCGPDPRYHVGMEVLALLRSSEGSWYTVGRSSGAKDVSHPGLRAAW